MMFLSEGPSIYPPPGFNYCVRIMIQIQSVLSRALNLYGASIMKPTTSAPYTSCPGVTPGPCLCVCVCLEHHIHAKQLVIIELAHITISLCDNWSPFPADDRY